MRTRVAYRKQITDGTREIAPGEVHLLLGAALEVLPGTGGRESDLCPGSVYTEDNKNLGIEALFGPDALVQRERELFKFAYDVCAAPDSGARAKLIQEANDYAARVRLETRLGMAPFRAGGKQWAALWVKDIRRERGFAVCSGAAFDEDLLEGEKSREGVSSLPPASVTSAARP
ncbi:MAG: hypothetical protein M3O22_02840, partial [Pseudomonadota bacterium]|nr:hypothetical protein [Pseudomonadota bacterium]